MDTIQHPHLKWYIENGFHSVHGYCKKHTAYVLDLIEQSPYNKKGKGVAEIGIHVGRFYILLNRTVTSPEFKSYAIDLFESAQEKNIDNSGRGNLQYFIENLKHHDLYEGNNTVILEGDSTDSGIKFDNIIEPGSLKYVSIDGGHTPTHVVNDLKLAEKWIESEGVVIVDDIMHEGWVGVVQGTLNYLSSHPTLQPFAIGYNKLWLSKVSVRQTYKYILENSPIARTSYGGGPYRQMFGGYEIMTLEDSGHVNDGA
jgi:effector-binding domain-containing protein